MATPVKARKAKDITRFETKVTQLRQAKADMKILKAFIDKTEAELKKLAGDAEELKIGDVVAITYVKADDFAFASWAAENPEQARACTTHVWKEELDKDKARSQFSATLEPYRKRVFLTK